MAISIRLILAFLLCIASSVQAQFDGLSSSDSLSSPQLLRVEQAFRPQALGADETVEIIWAIEPGYYMYRKQFRVFADGTEITQMDIPTGESAYDPFFDEELEIYRDETQLSFPLAEAQDLRVRFQGCADAGYCYPPSWVAFDPSADGDSVLYLGLVEGPGEPTEIPTHTNTRLYAIGLLGLFFLFGLSWQIYRRLSAAS